MALLHKLIYLIRHDDKVTILRAVILVQVEVIQVQAVAWMAAKQSRFSRHHKFLRARR